MEGIKEVQARTNGSQAMFLNLGRIFNAEIYSMFDRKGISIIEITGIDACWEKPPGLGVLPLKALFEVCKTVQHFLSFDEDNTLVRFCFEAVVRP